jgi:hypothetical protein
MSELSRNAQQSGHWLAVLITPLSRSSLSYPRDDLEGIIGQRSLQCLGLIPVRASTHPHSSSVVRITGIAFAKQPAPGQILVFRRDDERRRLKKIHCPTG